jgi:hypothetical protein
VAFGVKDGEADESDTSNEGTESRKGSEYAFTFAHRRHEPITQYHTSDAWQPRSATHLPVCPNHRSVTRHKKNPTPVIEHPITKSGLRISALMSKMYGIDPSMLT